MRMFAAALALEANTFLPLPTAYQAFLDKLHYPPGGHPEQPAHQTASLCEARRRARTDGFTLIEGSCYAAQPGGTATRDAFERMRDEILGEVRAALPLDAVVLGLHGAMVAQGYDDCEGDMLERVRDLVGPACVIGVELDPHCHLTVKRCGLADLMIMFKEYPHTDFKERAVELLDLVIRQAQGRIRPVKSVWDCRLLGHFPTSEPGMRALVDRVSALEGQDGVLSISIGHSFPHADVPEAGARILVITDNAKATGDRIAEQIGRALSAIRESAMPDYLGVDDALDRALGLDRAPGRAGAGGPVVIADTADNAGGGAPSDNTDFLHRLIQRGVTGAAVGPVWDPMAVRVAFDAGVGARLPLRFGGKTAATSGPPVDAEVEIVSCVRDAWQSFAGSRVPLGDAVAIRTSGGVEAVLISNRAQAMGTDLFSNLGIDPAGRKILVVKSEQHFHAAFSRIAADIIYARSSGPLAASLTDLPWHRLQRPIWPLDQTAEPYLLI